MKYNVYVAYPFCQHFVSIRSVLQITYRDHTLSFWFIHKEIPVWSNNSLYMNIMATSNK